MQLASIVTLLGLEYFVNSERAFVSAYHALKDAKERNRADLDDVPEHVRDEMTFHPVMSLDEVLGIANDQHHVTFEWRWEFDCGQNSLNK